MHVDDLLPDEYTLYPLRSRVEYVGTNDRIPLLARGKVIWHHGPGSRQAQAGRPLRAAFTLDTTTDTVIALDVSAADIQPI